MIDPRARAFVVETQDGHFIDTITKAIFKHDGTPSGRTVANELALQSVTKEIKVFDRLSRRILTERAIRMETIEHEEDRAPRELVKTTTNVGKVQRRNPHLAVIEHHERQLQRENETPREAMLRQAKEKAAEWDAKEKARAEKAELQARPDVAGAIADAKTILRRLRMTAGITVREIEAAEARLAMAEAGDVATYHEQTKAYKAERRAKFRERAAEIDAEATNHKQAEHDLLGDELGE